MTGGAGGREEGGRCGDKSANTHATTMTTERWGGGPFTYTNCNQLTTSGQPCPAYPAGILARLGGRFINITTGQDNAKPF